MQSINPPTTAVGWKYTFDFSHSKYVKVMHVKKSSNHVKVHKQNPGRVAKLELGHSRKVVFLIPNPSDHGKI